MCHFDQLLIFSSFLPAASPPANSHRALAHVMRAYVRGALPLIIALEFSAYGVFAANAYYQVSPLWRWYAAGLAAFLTHLANAPYSWRRLNAIRYGDGEEDGKRAGKEGRRTATAQGAALEEFVRMNRLRLLLTEVPLMVIAVAGAL